MGKFDFRGVHPGVEFGTASDRYAGWMGQIYTPGRYEGRITSRRKKLGPRTYEEKVLPVECVEEYFRHFGVLELDFTFYRFLLDEGGKPTGTYRTLEAYRRHLSGDDRVLLKVPQAVFARHLFRGKTYAANPDNLDAGLFTERFYKPATALMEPHLAGFIFEQEYQRTGERQDEKELASAMSTFFTALPGDRRYHVELRTEAYLKEPLFEVLERFGVGQVLSHWTWLPSLETQFRKADGRLFNSGRRCIIRLLTPRGMRYEEAYHRAFPFDHMVEGMMSRGMTEDTVHIMREVLKKNGEVTVIANNRAGGNAPLVAREVAGKFRMPEGSSEKERKE
jgi:uncharacterized protein YecE (DUF72 family)